MTCAEFLLQLTLGRSMCFPNYSGWVERDIPRSKTPLSNRHCHMFSSVKERCTAEMIRLGKRKSLWGKECSGHSPSPKHIHCHL